MKRTARYTVELELPLGWTKGDGRNYVDVAVRQWAKGGDPESESYRIGDKAKVLHSYKKTLKAKENAKT